VSPSRQQLEFFIDRSLGRYRVPQALRENGWLLRTHHEIYRERDEEILDVEWLELCGGEDMPVLSKDRRLRYRPAEIDAIRHFGVRAFILTAGSLSGGEQASRFDRSRARIEEACLDTGPFVYKVHANRIARVFPPP
jgi:PIN domain-containing protein